MGKYLSAIKIEIKNKINKYLADQVYSSCQNA